MANRIDPISLAYGYSLKKPEHPEISPVELLINQFEGHERQELEFIRGYKKIVDEHPNPSVRFLLQLVISDEEKHHTLVHAMASSLRANLTWQKSEEAIGRLDEISPETKIQLLQLTAEFIKEENKGIKEYRKLIKKSKEYYGGVFVLLLKTIIHDSKKHLMILQFLESRLKEA